MGYLHINNLYKDQTILQFKECYALEKIHGTSANISWVNNTLNFFSGGESYEKFVQIFNKEELKQKFIELGHDKVYIHGEAYGDKQQGMREVYGDTLKFVVFDVKIDSNWLEVPNAENVANKLGLEFVHYVRCSTELDSLDFERDKDSTQAIRNGIIGKKGEGVVLRPIFETYTKLGERIIAKHKRDEFKETKTSRKVDTSQQKILEDAKQIAEEWVTDMRLSHVLDKLENPSLDKAKELIESMVEDVYREGKGEIIESKEVYKSIAAKTIQLFKKKLNSQIKSN